MNTRIAIAALATAASLFSAETDRKVVRRPDFTGTYEFYIDTAPVALKRVGPDGKEILKAVDQTARHGKVGEVPGARAWKPAPAYKPELRAKQKDLADHESKTDPVFYCGRPGVPRIGAPRRIIQSAKEVIFFYEDISGDPYRIIPFAAKHREDANPSAYGNSIARWDGATLVVDSKDFSDETWFGEEGYFHTDAMRVTERFWKQGANMVYQVTVEDPGVLTEPWTMQPHVIRPSSEPLLESPACKEDDAKRLLNDDHHLQR